MNLYKAFLTQVGEGCDYTIGCAQTIVDVKASSMKEAKQVLSKMIIEDYGDEFDTGIDTAELYEIKEIFNLDVNEIYSKKEEIEQKHQQEIKEKEEYNEYKRLKEKYD